MLSCTPFPLCFLPDLLLLKPPAPEPGLERAVNVGFSRWSCSLSAFSIWLLLWVSSELCPCHSLSMMNPGEGQATCPLWEECGRHTHSGQMGCWGFRGLEVCC